MDLSKDAYKTLGDAVGMPDDEDYKYILGLIEAYDRKHPGELLYWRDHARDTSVASNNDWGLVKANGLGKNGGDLSGHRYMLEIPQVLHDKIEKYIPTIFRDKKHFGWFKKKFPGLLIPRKF